MALRNIGCDYSVVGILEVDKNALIAYDSIHNNNEKVEVVSKDEMLSEFADKNIGYNFSTGKSEIPRKEEDIRKLYEAHIRSRNYGDIRKLDVSVLPEFDLFTYSYPCKNVSVAGQQAGLDINSGTQSALLWECERVIQAKKPKYLLMENVKNLVGATHMPNFKKWQDILSEMGYSNHWAVLNASNYGLPQNRERVIMVSILGENEFKFNLGVPTTVCIEDILSERIDLGCNMLRLKEDITSPVSALYQVGMTDKKGNDSNRRIYSTYGYSPTLNSMNGGNRQPKFIDKDGKLIKLSPLECWRIMGYTDEDYYKAKNAGLPKTRLYERAGRGIAVPMLEEIFREMLKY